jgi:biotin carboxyl carrier protein
MLRAKKCKGSDMKFTVVNSKNEKKVIHKEDVFVLKTLGAQIVHNKIIRISHLKTVGNQKKQNYRMQVGAFSNVHNLHVSPVRPVEPKVTAASMGGGPLKAPMTGKVISVLVKNDDAVLEGQLLFTIEAMKMENRICAECNGTISGLKLEEGMSLAAGDLALVLNPKINSKTDIN